MSEKKLDIKELQTVTIVFSLCLLMAVSMVAGCWYFQGIVQKEVQLNRARFQSVSQQYLMVDQEEGFIEEYYPAYKKLLEEGIIGQEYRLNWIEVLRNANENNRFHSVNYQIAPQNEYDFEFPVETGSFKVYASIMNLDLKLLHEDDFLYLLNELDNKAKGHYTIKHCTFKRAGKVFTQEIKRSNVITECDLHWYSIKNLDGSELSES